MPPPSRNHDRVDGLAIQAARLFVDGAVETVAAAIAVVGKQGGDMRGVTGGMVRRHIEAMSMVRLGAEGHQRRRASILEIGEELMTLLEHGLEDATTFLVGSAAAGRLDGDVTLHLRVHCAASIGEIAALVVDGGSEEPRFVTAHTRVGRLDRIEFVERSDAGAIPMTTAVAMTRCASLAQASSSVDLHTGRSIATLDLERLRAAIGALSRFRP